MVIDVSLSLSLYFDEDVDDDDVRFCGDLSFLTTTISLLPPLQQPLLFLSLFFFLVKVVKKRLRTQPLPR